MNRQQSEGIAEGGLSATILPWIEQPERLDELRQFLSDYTHRCRNSLHGIKMGLYLYRRGIEGPPPETWAMLERAYQEAEQLFDRLQEIYRPMRTAMVRARLGQLFDERLPVWKTRFAARGVVLEADPPAEELLGDYDPMHLGSALDAFISWRIEAKHGDGNIRLGWRVRKDLFEIEWTEEDSHQPGGFDDQEAFGTCPFRAPPGGDSLALPLLARVAGAHGGRVIFSGNSAWRLVVTWPQFASNADLG